MEGIRHAWRVLSFSSNDSASQRSSTTTTTRKKSVFGRRQHGRPRRMTLYRACSVPLSSSSESGKPARSVRPGAYDVIRSRGPSRQHRVKIPDGTLPGTEFTAFVGTQEVQITCPESSHPGNFVRVMVPGEPIKRQSFLKMATLTKTHDLESLPVAVPVVKHDKIVASTKIRVPLRVRPGMAFVATTKNGEQYSVVCPEKVPCNRKIHVIPKLMPNQDVLPSSNAADLLPSETTTSESGTKTEGGSFLEVFIPEGVMPDQFFEIEAHGQTLTLQCPEDLFPGQTAQWNMEDVVGDVALKYDEEVAHGWQRCVRPCDFQFQWIHSSSNPPCNNDVAFCRQLCIQAGQDHRLPTGTLKLVPASESQVDSSLKIGTGKEETVPTVSFSTIASIQAESLEEKTRWFRSVCKSLSPGMDETNIKLVVRRDHLLEDSIKAIMSLGKDHMRKPWRIEFVHEPGVDSGGVTREWFHLVSEQLFDPDNGMWVCTDTNQMCLSINPDSANACLPGDHLVRFRFAGRLLGRAVYDQQMVKGHLSPSLYKLLLGWPLLLNDLASQDEEYFNSLKKLKSMDDIASMCLDFTVTEEIDGGLKVIELVDDGANRSLTNDNLEAFFEALLKYRMVGRFKPQLTELLLGFFDVVPEVPLAVFDPRELEVMLCGLPSIDVEDWRAHTRYTGTLAGVGEETQLVQWFWDIVRNFDHEMKSRLLQFATGTSGVPPAGFSALRGADGSVKHFAIHGMESTPGAYPKSHTCFNRIDLPSYETKEDLLLKLQTALAVSSVGFGMD